jgi:hypothetical protein
MKEIKEKEKLFNFRKYQNAEKSRKMLVRFILYSIVIGILFYLILTETMSSSTSSDNGDVEAFEIEIEQN